MHYVTCVIDLVAFVIVLSAAALYLCIVENGIILVK